MSPLPDSWFDDALFFGDSISVTLKKHCAKTGDLSDALFLCEFSYSVRNAYTGNLKIWYQTKQYAPEDVVPLTGANKLFVMLGVNDIALDGGIDKAMMCWDVFVSRIREKSPDIVFFIESSLPIYHDAEYDAWNNKLFDEYNERLRQFCEENDCVFVDIAHYFKDDRNSLAPEFCSDYFCHVTYEATAVWAEQLKNPENYSVNPRSIDYGPKA